MAQIRQSGPDYGLGLQIKVLKTFEGVPSSLGSGPSGQKGEGLSHEDDASAIVEGGARGTSLIRNSAPLGPCSRNMPRALWCS